MPRSTSYKGTIKAWCNLMLRYQNTEVYRHSKAKFCLFHEIFGHLDIQGRKLVASTSGIWVETVDV